MSKGYGKMKSISKGSLVALVLAGLVSIGGMAEAADMSTNETVKIEQGRIYSKAHEMSLSDNMESVRYPNGGITLAGNVYFPKDFDKSKQYPAIVVGHPGGGVKEQTAGLYARLLAEQGFVTIAFDAGYQGESSGTPRHVDIPQLRITDYSATIDYLDSLPYVDTARIGVLGICAGGGTATSTAISDKRIKALGTVSAFMRFNTGWDGTPLTVEQKLAALNAAAEARTKEARGEGATYANYLFPPTAETPKDLAEAYEYYLTERGQYPTAGNKLDLGYSSLSMVYNALEGAELLVQPTLLIAGSEAGSLWQSQQIYDAIGAKDKELFLVKGANHMSMYDNADYVGQAVKKLAAFYKKNL